MEGKVYVIYVKILIKSSVIFKKKIKCNLTKLQEKLV